MYRVLAVCYIHWVFRPTASYSHLPNNKSHTFVTAAISAKTYVLHNTQQQHSSSQLTPYQCIRTYLPIQPSCLLQDISVKNIPEECPKQNEALIAGLKLVLLNNIFSFGNMTFKQLNGTAMGTPQPPPPPPPPHATIYYGLHASKIFPNHRQHVIFYKRFIDDVFGSWLPHPNAQINKRLWDEFTKSMNNYPGLTWEFNPPSDKVDFMDLTISIQNGSISTSLFEKPLNLHLYITPPPPPPLCPPAQTPPRHRPQYPIKNFYFMF